MTAIYGDTLRQILAGGRERRWCRRIAGAFGCVLGLTAGLADAQTPASAVAQPLNPTQEIARETPEGPPLVAGQTEIRIGGYLGVTGIYRSTNSGGAPGPVLPPSRTAIPQKATSRKRG